MFRRALAAYRLWPAAHLLLLTLCTCAFVLSASGYLVAKNADQLLSKWSSLGQVVVYLREDATDREARIIAEALVQTPAVEEVEYVTRDRARERLAQTLGEASALVQSVETGFFPATIEVRLTPGAWELAGVTKLVDRLELSPAVSTVDFGGQWVDRLHRARTIAIAGASIISAIGLLLGLSVIFGSMRLGVMARRREVEVLRLCGATNNFVRGPFLLEGAIAGLAAISIGLAVVAVGFTEAAPVFSDSLGFAFDGQPSFFDLREGIALVLAATLLGATASGAAVEPHLG